VVAVGVGAVLVAAGVWMSVAGDVLELVDGAGWWSLLALAFPAFITFAVWRGWGDGG